MYYSVLNTAAFGSPAKMPDRQNKIRMLKVKKNGYNIIKSKKKSDHIIL